MARPPKPDAEQLVSVSIRMPRPLIDEAKDRARLRRTTLTALMLEGLRLCLDTPIDPREVPVSHSMTAIQELEQMIDARVHAILATERQREPVPQPKQPMTGLSSDARKTVMQAQGVVEDAQGGNAVIPGQPAEYDAAKYRLGKLCPRGHTYQATGQSLRYRGSKRCIQCDTEDAQTRRTARKRTR